MPQLSPNSLTNRAQAQCSGTMQKLLNSPVATTPGTPTTEWNPILRRHIFEQSFVVWKQFDTVEIVFDKSGQIISFRDLARLDPKQPPNLEFPPDPEILKIAGTSGLLGPSAVVGRVTVAMKNLLVATVTQREPQLPATIQFTINPAARQIAAFVVPQGVAT